ncbi:MAG: hypothetical protein M1392_06440 [Gammaproteobacteria bacterium]|nr:hypothetical protein [Gammaproteobacteria bacterium]
MNDMTTNKSSGLLLAAAAAALFSATPFVTAHAAEMGKIHCEGVNSCKGKSATKGKNDCKGKNSCKGKGFLEMTQEECDAAKAGMMEEEMMKK